jgi:hypothetical protein
MRHFVFYILTALCLMPSALYSQGLSLPLPDRNNKEWRRINTGQDSTTDVGVSTLVLEPNGIFRATFRIELSKSEEASEKPGAKYKTRLMTIQFDSRKKTYRTFETKLLDSSDKVVYESGPTSTSTWRPLVRSSYTYFSAAVSLPPLGLWKVASSSDSQTISADGAFSVATTMDRFQVGRNTCSAPNYESTSMTRDEVAKLTGLGSQGDVQMAPEKVNVVKIKCDSPNLTSEIHILIPRSIDRAVLLSGGTLYALEK